MIRIPCMPALTGAIALLLLAGSPTRARSFPIPASNWSVPAQIPVVGLFGGVPDPVGEITIIARDLANLPINNALVTIDFSNCLDLRLCADPHDPSVTVDCANMLVRKFTNVAGVAKFRVVGCGDAVPGSPQSPDARAQILGDGPLIHSAKVAIYDLTGEGLGPPDLSAFLGDFFGAQAPRIDYDGNGIVGAADLSKWLGVFFEGGSMENCAWSGNCP